VTTPPQEITRLLGAHTAGDAAAFERLVPLVYEELREVARRQLRRLGAGGQTLNATALVHEAYDKLLAERSLELRDRGHFFAIAARTMRRILVDHFRHHSAQKRWGGLERVGLEGLDLAAADEADGTRVLAVDSALATLEAIEPRLARLVECRFFCGCSEDETAEALDVSRSTVQRDWRRARAWLRRELASGASA
jgi:RNA polymerase sigma factor (TIGR02999 family)